MHFYTYRSYKEQLTIIERIKACHNPKITADNKPKMEVSCKMDCIIYNVFSMQYVAMHKTRDSRAVRIAVIVLTSSFDPFIALAVIDGF